MVGISIFSHKLPNLYATAAQRRGHHGDSYVDMLLFIYALPVLKCLSTIGRLHSPEPPYSNGVSPYIDTVVNLDTSHTSKRLTAEAGLSPDCQYSEDKTKADQL